MISKLTNCFLVALMLLATGCMNLYVRCLGTQSKIIDTYQCTKETTALSYIVMFPQIMGYGNDKGLIIENVFTIPIGCLCFVDVACEAIVDTVCWPIDQTISSSRSNN